MNINIEKGVRQRDTISPKLFSAYLEDIFINLDWDNEGIRIHEDYLNHLKFADNIILFCKNVEELQRHMEQLEEKRKKGRIKDEHK